MGITYKDLGGKRINKEHVGEGKRKKKNWRGRAPNVS